MISIKFRTIQLLFYFFAFCNLANATITDARKCITLTEGWTIYPATDVSKKAVKTPVVLPHTWNAEYLQGTLAYNRETMVYQYQLDMPFDIKTKRVFIYFEGVNSVANVLVNTKFVGEHKGGYTAFCFEITTFLKPDTVNDLDVWVSNAYRQDVLPLSGDFVVYGGIHRPCHLIITDKNCISPLDYASPGVYIKPVEVTADRVKFDLISKLSFTGNKNNLEIQTRLLDNTGKLVLSKTDKISEETVNQSFELINPILWNGRKNPYLYTAEVRLIQNGVEIDKVVQKTGFRYFNVDADKGFILNGNYLNLYGFCRHEEIKGKGSALSAGDVRHDMQLINEIGATSMRLTHYPHTDLIYDLCDETGVILWTEIPFCGPGGFTGTGYINSPALNQHLKTTLIELIRQKYNHPSVCFWGLFNEILTNYDSPVPILSELNNLAKTEDKSRLTAFATCFEQKCYLETADLVAWNKYFGWYQAKANEAGVFFDQMKSEAGGKPVGVSEYGAGASIFHHQNPIMQPKPGGSFHPEEWQTLVHEGNWEAFSTRPYLWGKYIWVFADFQSNIRSEGDTPGINDKGLVTHDHNTKKDAFYFYKANWNPEPMLYISNRRFTQRENNLTDIKAFSNLSSATLYVNSKKIGQQNKDKLNRIIWKNVMLQKGSNEIKIKGKFNKQLFTDTCTWIVK